MRQQSCCARWFVATRFMMRNVLFCGYSFSRIDPSCTVRKLLERQARALLVPRACAAGAAARGAYRAAAVDLCYMYARVRAPCS